MAILKVAHMGNPILRKCADAVAVEDIVGDRIQTLIDDMILTMREYDGAGLAAPQVHVSLRVVVFEVQNNPRYPNVESIPLTVAINPKVTPLSENTMGMWEGCLSVPGMRGYVERPSKVRFEALDRNGDPLHAILDGFAAVVVQHECDHLDGRLFLDRMRNMTQLAFLPEYQKYVLQNVADLDR